MRAKLALFTVAAALIAPSTALAGGFATVGVSPPPEGLEPGATWRMEVTVLQHGVTPMEVGHPRVIVTGAGTREVFSARETARPGVYRAAVTFPGAGTWRYAVADDFGQTHGFPPLRIGARGDTVAATTAPVDGGGPDVALALAIAAVAGLAAALGLAVLRRRPTPG